MADQDVTKIDEKYTNEILRTQRALVTSIADAINERYCCKFEHDIETIKTYSLSIYESPFTLPETV